MIYGIAGPAYAGKTEVSNIIADIRLEPYYYLPFAKALKDLAKWFGWDGAKDERGRAFLQRLGTDVGRCYNADFWVNKWHEVITQQYPKEVGFVAKIAPCVVADDVRYDNEAALIRKMGGIIIQVQAEEDIRKDRAAVKGASIPPNHPSEDGIGIPPDHIIYNNTSIEALREQVTKICNGA